MPDTIEEATGKFSKHRQAHTHTHTHTHTEEKCTQRSSHLPHLSHSMYERGMQPLMYSTTLAEQRGIGWRRVGHGIQYSPSLIQPPNTTKQYYALSWECEFPCESDVVYFAHCYPFSYSDLQRYLAGLLSRPDIASRMRVRTLCKTVAGNNCYLLTVSAFDKKDFMKFRPAIVVTARVHPGETNSSWMMKGVIDFLVSDDPDAQVCGCRYFVITSMILFGLFVDVVLHVFFIMHCLFICFWLVGWLVGCLFVCFVFVWFCFAFVLIYYFCLFFVFSFVFVFGCCFCCDLYGDDLALFTRLRNFQILRENFVFKIVPMLNPGRIFFCLFLSCFSLFSPLSLLSHIFMFFMISSDTFPHHTSRRSHCRQPPLQSFTQRLEPLLQNTVT